MYIQQNHCQRNFNQSFPKLSKRQIRLLTRNDIPGTNKVSNTAEAGHKPGTLSSKECGVVTKMDS